MTESNISLEDQLAITLDAMEETQKSLQSERTEWTKQRGILLKDMERERTEFAAVRGELAAALHDSAQRSVTGLVAAAARLLAKEAAQDLRAHVSTELGQAQTNLSTAASKGKEVAECLGLIAQALKVTWKTSLERTFIQVLPTGMALVIVGTFISLWLRSDADTAKQRMLEWTQTHSQTVQEHERMKTEMEAWKQAGIGKVKLVPCPDIVAGLCIRVDKKRGALGPNKDLFVPAQL